MQASLDWPTIFSETRPLRVRDEVGSSSPTATSKLLAMQDLPETPAIPLDQLGIWTNDDSIDALIHVIGGASFAKLGATGVVLVEPRIFADHRGIFFESFHAEKFAQAGMPSSWVQDNHSLSRKSVLRGLHYQIRKPQGKLIRAVHGEVFDVAVDLRKSSPTFGKWFGTLLSAENKRMIFIPPGFAHGFCTYSDDAEVVYKCTDLYSPENERTLVWNDPTVAIRWPVDEPILADKDKLGKTLNEAELFE